MMMMMKNRRILLLVSLVCLCVALIHYYSPNNSSISELVLRFIRLEQPLPIIFAITPTYARLVQKAELTRICHTFRQVPALHWIVVEDATEKTQLVTNFLKSCGVPYTHLCFQSPKDLTKARGTFQRNLGLSWLRETFYPEDAPRGVVYFADDDNTYSLELFEEMRYTEKVSVWPVGLAGGIRFESVKVNAEGKVIGWLARYEPSRTFAIDMAGFAINLKLILERSRALFRIDVDPGYQEPSLLQDLVTMEELEPRAANCTKVLVWHTRTAKPSTIYGPDFPDTSTEV